MCRLGWLKRSESIPIGPDRCIKALWAPFLVATRSHTPYSRAHDISPDSRKVKTEEILCGLLDWEAFFKFFIYGNCVPWSHLWLTLRFCPLISWMAYDLSILLCLAHLESPMMLFHVLSLLASAPSILFNKCKFLLGDSRKAQNFTGQPRDQMLYLTCSVIGRLRWRPNSGNPTARTCSHSSHGWSSPSRRHGRYKLPSLCSCSWALAMSKHHCRETHYRKRSVLASEWRS